MTIFIPVTAATPGNALAEAIRRFPPGTPVRAIVSGGVNGPLKSVRGFVARAGFGVDENGDPFVRVQPDRQGDEDGCSSMLSSIRVPVNQLERTDFNGREETTKHVTVVVTAKFSGDYYGADEVAGCLEGWVDSAFEDRDDLREWTMTPVSVVETPMAADEDVAHL